MLHQTSNESIISGEVLGAGAFGVVLKGLAVGILTNEQETVVAVKKLKETADKEVKRDVTSLKQQLK